MKLKTDNTTFLDGLFLPEDVVVVPTENRPYESNAIVWRNVLIYGSQGSGKSETVRAIVEKAVEKYGSDNVNAVQIPATKLELAFGLLNSKPIQICLHPDTPIAIPSGNCLLREIKIGQGVLGLSKWGIIETKVLALKKNFRASYKIEFEDGRELRASGEHKFLTSKGWKETQDLNSNDYIIVWDKFGKEMEASRGKGKRVYSAELSEYDIEAIGSEIGKKYTFNQLLNLERGSEEDLWFSLQKQESRVSSNFGRGCLSCGDYRRRRKPFDKKRFRERIFHSHLTGSKYGLKPYELAGEENSEEETENEKFQPRLKMEDEIYPRQDRSRYLSSLGKNNSLFDCKEKISTFDKEIYREEDGRLLGSDLYGRGKKNSSFGQISECKKLKVKRILEAGDREELWDITTGTGNFIANGVISHNCFIDDFTLIKHKSETLQRFFEIRHIWSRKTGRKNGYIITIEGIHRFHSLQLEFRNVFDYLILRNSPDSLYDRQFLGQYFSNKSLDDMRGVEIGRLKDRRLFGYSLWRDKTGNQGFLELPMAKKNYLNEIRMENGRVSCGDKREERRVQKKPRKLKFSTIFFVMLGIISLFYGSGWSGKIGLLFGVIILWAIWWCAMHPPEEKKKRGIRHCVVCEKQLSAEEIREHRDFCDNCWYEDISTGMIYDQPDEEL